MGSSERTIPFCVQYTFIIFGGGQSGQVLLRLGSALPQRPQAATGIIRIFLASSSTVSEMPGFNPNFSRNDFGIVICPLALIFTSNIKRFSSIKKRCAAEAHAPKNANPDCCETNHKQNWGFYSTQSHPCGICVFTKFFMNAIVW